MKGWTLGADLCKSDKTRIISISLSSSWTFLVTKWDRVIVYPHSHLQDMERTCFYEKRTCQVHKLGQVSSDDVVFRWIMIITRNTLSEVATISSETSLGLPILFSWKQKTKKSRVKNIFIQKVNFFSVIQRNKKQEKNMVIC